MPSNQSSQSSGAKASNSSANGSGHTEKPVTKYRIVKDGWGGRRNFQHSYGLGMDDDSIQEGNAILEAMLELERRERR